MEVKLIGAIDYEKLKKYLKEENVENSDKIIEYINKLELFERVKKVAASGRISRFAGDVFEILGITGDKTLEENVKYIEKVVSLGHESITDHDYFVFAIKNVSPVIEQTIIAERFSSFTIKSRRLVDFSNVGFYTPDFHDKEGNVLANNKSIQEVYNSYMKSLFESYSFLVKEGLNVEDARFCLPYCYYSNIIMGVDAHTLKDMIIKYTKKHLANIQEIKEFGDKLLEIAKINCPYIIPLIEKEDIEKESAVKQTLDKVVENKYQILPKAKLLSCSKDIDNTILAYAIMRRYQVTLDDALNIINRETELNPNFKKDLMQKIIFEDDKLELTQVNFSYQIPISFAVLTHLTRHRTHDILIPEFCPVVDLTQYKIPPAILKNKELLQYYQQLYTSNIFISNYFKNGLGIREEDLVYFTLSGNMVNVITNMNGKTLEHILALRECNRAQWETREMAINMHQELNKMEDAQIFSSFLGATCDTMRICHEGKQSCGKLQMLLKKEESK